MHKYESITVCSVSVIIKNIYKVRVQSVGGHFHADKYEETLNRRQNPFVHDVRARLGDYFLVGERLRLNILLLFFSLFAIKYVDMVLFCIKMQKN